MRYLRTPDSCFANLPEYPFVPHYVMVDDTEGGQLRMHYLDEGERQAPVVLMLHGEPSWSFLYRKMIPLVVAAGYRVIVPDLIGFGRSDKPTEQSDYSHSRHIFWVDSLLKQLQLKDMVLVCQDWGGLIGLRLVAEQPELFAGVVAANTMLPAFPLKHPNLRAAFSKWQQLRATVGFGSWFSFSQLYPSWTAAFVINVISIPWGIEQSLLVTFGWLAVVASIAFVSFRTPVYAALSFTAIVLDVCGIYILNTSPFLAASTMIVYAGATITSDGCP